MSDEGGGTPADVVQEDRDERGNPSIVQRDSGHLGVPGVAGHGGPGNNGTPWEVNRHGEGCRWVST